MIEEYDILLEISADDVKKAAEERDNQYAEITRLREENARLEERNKKLNADLFKQAELTAVTMTRCADLMPAQSATVKLKEYRREIEGLRELLDDVWAQWDGDWPEELVARVKAAISGGRVTGDL